MQCTVVALSGASPSRGCSRSKQNPPVPIRFHLVSSTFNCRHLCCTRHSTEHPHRRTSPPTLSLERYATCQLPLKQIFFVYRKLSTFPNMAVVCFVFSFDPEFPVTFSVENKTECSRIFEFCGSCTCVVVLCLGLRWQFQLQNKTERSRIFDLRGDRFLFFFYSAWTSGMIFS